eukprot:TRINITY_DN22477_c0_g1_i2.p1 TRINITY_DN22477_c0_g1~~TRINITY_DN22477_c0_g1_i2.p1  ORF type:complete len:222 (+),score=52.44 TRINITY_DN22477_c0_g1_i2:129-794(+)
MDVALDDIISKDRKGKGRGKGGGRVYRDRDRDPPRAARRRSDDDDAPRAGADDLRELESFGALMGSAGKGRSSKGRNGYSRSDRYEPYGGGGSKGSGGKGKGRKSSDWFEDDDRSGSDGPKTISIGNLDFGVMDADLEDLLAEFGVEKAWINYDSTDRSLGEGGATFATAAGAWAACRRYHGSVMDGQRVHMALDNSGGKKGKGRGKGKGKSKDRDLDDRW